MNTYLNRILLAVLCSLALSASVLEAAPQRPAGVDPKATYYTKSKVWFLTANGVRSVWYSNGQLKARGPYSVICPSL